MTIITIALVIDTFLLLLIAAEKIESVLVMPYQLHGDLYKINVFVSKNNTYANDDLLRNVPKFVNKKRKSILILYILQSYSYQKVIANVKNQDYLIN